MAKTKPKSRKKRFLVIFICEMIVIIGIVLAVFLYTRNSMHKINRDASQDQNIQKNEEVQTGKGYRSIAIFGGDSRQNRLEDATHSDVIIIASIDKKTKNVKLASVYRDTYVNIPDRNKYDKINAAYYRGGYSLALTTLNKNFDLDISEYVTVNFKAVVYAVDLLGGINMDVKDNEVKWLNGYVRELNRINGTDVPGIKSSGPQLLNGTQACAYSRIRYTSGGDFARTDRQRRVIDEIFKKLKSSNIKTINNFINQVFPQVSTNLTDTELLGLAKDILSYNIVDQTGFPFEKTTGTRNRVSYVFPVDLADNVTKLHAFLYNETDYKPSTTVKGYSDYIVSLK